MKKQLAILLTLALLLALCACGSQPAEESAAPTEAPAIQTEEPATPTEAPAAQTEAPPLQTEAPAPLAAAPAFDEKLVGAWNTLSKESAGTMYTPLENVDGLRYILPDGTVSLYGLDYQTLVTSGLEPLRLSAAGGEIDGQAVLDYLVNIKAMEQAEADKYENLRIHYEFRDLAWDEVKDIRNRNKNLESLFNEDKEDCLVLRLTADYRKDALTVEKVDVTVQFWKDCELYADDFYAAYLFGDWSDSRGNSWHFDYDSDGSFFFTMIDAGGAKHESMFLSYSEERDGEVSMLGFLSFVFEDFSSPWYTVTARSQNSLVLRSESGDLVLTRK